jgi:hypothetical protein
MCKARQNGALDLQSFTSFESVNKSAMATLVWLPFLGPSIYHHSIV